MPVEKAHGRGPVRVATPKRGDYATAVRLIRPLADQGEADAQNILGLMYYNGQGVPRDYVIAHMWLSLVAAGGNVTAARDFIAAKMTPAQMAEAQKLAREWKPKQLARTPLHRAARAGLLGCPSPRKAHGEPEHEPSCGRRRAPAAERHLPEKSKRQIGRHSRGRMGRARKAHQGGPQAPPQFGRVAVSTSL
jgi:hypothetical protein